MFGKYSDTESCIELDGSDPLNRLIYGHVIELDATGGGMMQFAHQSHGFNLNAWLTLG